MKRRLYLLAICIVTTLSAGYLSARRDFIRDVTFQGWHICATIDPSKVWRIGNSAGQLVEQIEASTQISIDLSPMKNIEIWSTNDLNIEYWFFGSSLFAKTYHGSTGVCASTAGLQNGKHWAEVSTYTTWGERLSYTWLFEVYD